MKLWRKLLAAVTAGTICLGSIGAMLSRIIMANLQIILIVAMDGELLLL